MNATILIQQETTIHPLQHINPVLLSVIQENAVSLMKKKESRLFLKTLPQLTETEIATGLIIFHSKRYISFKADKYTELIGLIN